MRRKLFTTLITTLICLLTRLPLLAQLQMKVDKPEPLDTINLNVTKKVTKFLEQQKVNGATAYFRFKSQEDQRKITKQLEKLSKDIQTIKPKAKVLFQRSFKNYKDSFNIDQVIYYNEEGRFYPFELFYLKGDTTSRIVDIFVKDPAVIEKKRKEISEFRKKNPDIPQPPQSLPPGVYIKERN